MRDKEYYLGLKKYKDLNINGLNVNTLLSMYRFMKFVRKTQLLLKEEYHPADEIRCPVHFCIGEEATPAALQQVILKDDYVFCDHRSHGFYFAKGGDLESLFAELYGKSTGCNGGIAGSQEICMPAINFYSGAILSGMLSIAIGAALSFKIKNENKIAVAIIGDGAVDEGVVWESISYASTQKVPLVVLCENNGFSTYSPLLKRQPKDNISERVEAFGLKTYTLFGNDAPALYRTIKEAADYSRLSHEPTFIEAFTCRWNSHVGPEEDNHIGYRTIQEENFWKNNCPIKLLEEKLLTNDIINNLMIKEIENDLNKIVDNALDYAKSSPFPKISNWTDVNIKSNKALADKLLADVQSDFFDSMQTETIPEPY